jgi:hypothetical protein
LEARWRIIPWCGCPESIRGPEERYFIFCYEGKSAFLSRVEIALKCEIEEVVERTGGYDAID